MHIKGASSTGSMHQGLINFEFARTDIQSSASEYEHNELGILVNTSQAVIQTTRMHSQTNHRF